MAPRLYSGALGGENESMSVGCFMGIRASYIDEAQDVGEALIAACSQCLSAHGLPQYEDPRDPPNVYQPKFGRSSLDHHSASCLVAVAELVQVDPGQSHLAIISLNPYRLVFAPFRFPVPLLTQHAEKIGGEDVRIWLGSSVGLLAELLETAPLLGIPLTDGVLTDTVAGRIDDFEPLYEGDDLTLAEDERTAWLVLHEAARLSIEHRVALSLAG